MRKLMGYAIVMIALVLASLPVFAVDQWLLVVNPSGTRIFMVPPTDPSVVSSYTLMRAIERDNPGIFQQFVDRSITKLHQEFPWTFDAQGSLVPDAIVRSTLTALVNQWAESELLAPNRDALVNLDPIDVIALNDARVAPSTLHQGRHSTLLFRSPSWYTNQTQSLTATNSYYRGVQSCGICPPGPIPPGNCAPLCAEDCDPLVAYDCDAISTGGNPARNRTGCGPNAFNVRGARFTVCLNE